MVLTQVDNPGPAGKDVIWDFSGIPQKGPFRGEVTDPSVMLPEMELIGANTCLVEGHLQAFMVSGRKKLEVLGLRVPASKMIRIYDAPVVKMKYPFRYGSQYHSSATGKETYNNNYTFEVEVDNTLHADAIGTLILPGTTLKNALRVVTTQKITYKHQHGTSTSVVETYRWYVKSHRYPVLSLIYDRTKDGNLRSVKAAYNPVVEPEALLAKKSSTAEGEEENHGALTSLNARPNPFSSTLTVSYTIEKRTNVIIALYNIQGYLVKTLYQGELEAGTYENTFSSDVQGLAAAPYILRVEAQGKALTQKLIKM